MIYNDTKCTYSHIANEHTNDIGEILIILHTLIMIPCNGINHYDTITTYNNNYANDVSSRGGTNNDTHSSDNNVNEHNSTNDDKL